MRSRGAAFATTLACALGVVPAFGQPPLPSEAHAASPPASASPGGPSSDLRGRFGLDLATRLARSTDPDERLRGVERAATIHTPEALAFLEKATSPLAPGAFDFRAPIEGFARLDTRALLVAVRALSAWTDHETARQALASVLTASPQSFPTRLAGTTPRDPAAGDAESAARLLLAREEAAIGLAASGNTLVFEALLTAARSSGPGQDAALAALSLDPPVPPLLGGVTLTTPLTVSLAVGDADLRALDTIEGSFAASDPVLRASALVALGMAGDARVLDVARQAERDKDPRVRVAAARALAQLAAPEAATALEPLLADDVTAEGALRVAQLVQGDGITRAAAARAKASAEPLRSLAIAALGRQVSPLAIQALVELARDPALAGDAADALARSPGHGAMAALDSLAATPATRRLAARAYWVRRSTRNERDGLLDGLLRSMARATDPVDRAVGLEALVAMGEASVKDGLRDPDAQVRRAVAMALGARTDRDSRAAAIDRLGVEQDPTARELLLLALVDSDASPRSAVPTRQLVEYARSGEADAPIAALVLGRDADQELEPEIDALLTSRDPLVRAHVARGLGRSATPDAVGRIARAYDFEADRMVRRALVDALASRTADADTPSRRDTLTLAARLDPDRRIREHAARALARKPLTPWPPVPSVEVAWVRILAAEGAQLPPGLTGTLTGDDGLARPLAFDSDGYALVPGLPPGDARLRLASRVPAYEAR